MKKKFSQLCYSVIISLCVLTSAICWLSLSSYAQEPDHDEHGHDEHGHEGHEDENVFEFDWPKAEAQGVTMVEVKPSKLFNILKLYGEIALDGDSIVHVVPRFPGTLKRVTKHLGESVKSGDLLAVVQSNESLSPYEIRAEIDGMVIDKDATRGEFVSNDKEMFVLANLDKIWVNIAVPLQNFRKIRVGTPVSILSKSIGMKEQGQIDYIRSTLSEETRTALARVVLDNSDGKWAPGMFVTVEAQLDAQDVSLAVPAEAIVQMENKSSVFLQAKSEDGDQGFEVRQVEPGKSDGKMTEILSGLKSGELVASGNTFILKAQFGRGAAEHSH